MIDDELGEKEITPAEGSITATVKIRLWMIVFHP